MLPGSRLPRVANRSRNHACRPRLDRQVASLNSGQSLPSPSRNTTIQIPARAHEFQRGRRVRNHVAVRSRLLRELRARVQPFDPVQRYQRRTIHSNGLETFVDDASDRSSSFSAGMITETLVIAKRCVRREIKNSAQISASASVIGPAAIFGSSLTDARVTERQDRETSGHKERAMLPPMAPALRKSLRQNHTIAATTLPQTIRAELPSSIRDGAQLQTSSMSPAPTATLMVTLIDCALTAFVQAEHHCEKERDIRLRARVASNAPARIAQIVPAATVPATQGKRNRKTRHGDARGLFEMNPRTSNTSSRTGVTGGCSSRSPTFPRQTD